MRKRGRHRRDIGGNAHAVFRPGVRRLIVGIWLFSDADSFSVGFGDVALTVGLGIVLGRMQRLFRRQDALQQKS
ncbi:MAG: hypothetical protein WDN69_04165 [Aliidongia sp.]